MNSTDSDITALLTSVAHLLTLAGGIMAGLGMQSTAGYHYVEVGAGAVVAVGSALFSIYSAIQKIRIGKAQGVQAGISLTTSGQAVDDQGNIISKFAPGATPPKAVTLQTADAIIKDFPTPASAIAKS